MTISARARRVNKDAMTTTSDLKPKIEQFSKNFYKEFSDLYKTATGKRPEIDEEMEAEVGKLLIFYGMYLTKGHLFDDKRKKTKKKPSK